MDISLLFLASHVTMAMCCANCGKGGGDEVGHLRTCNSCKMVKYCNADCQKAHRPQHKRACKQRAAELLVEEELFNKPEKEPCPICMLQIPLEKAQYQSCCGKVLCEGCLWRPILQKDLHNQPMERIIQNAQRGALIDPRNNPCAFCRAPAHRTDEEFLEMLHKRVAVNDAEAIALLGGEYDAGMNLPRDQHKAIKLYHQAAKLGNANAHFNLGIHYTQGHVVARDEKRAYYHWAQAAIRGNEYARCNLGHIEERSGHMNRAMKHYMIAAAAGDDKALNPMLQGYKRGYVTKEEYGEALRAYQNAQEDMKSYDREIFTSMKAGDMTKVSSHIESIFRQKGWRG